MSKKTDILIIGAGPAGVVCAVTARKYYPSKSIVVMKDVADGVIPCGIPYMFSSLDNPDENKLGMASLEKNNIEIAVDTAVSINRKEKTVDSTSKNRYSYEKLVLAVGSTPLILPIKGIDKKGVYPIHKEMGYLKEVVSQIKLCKNILVIGGGFIGVEFADELAGLKGVNVTLVEMLPRLLANSFDPEFSQMAEERLKEKGLISWLMPGLKK